MRYDSILAVALIFGLAGCQTPNRSTSDEYPQARYVIAPPRLPSISSQAKPGAPAVRQHISVSGPAIPPPIQHNAMTTNAPGTPVKGPVGFTNAIPGVPAIDVPYGLIRSIDSVNGAVNVLALGAKGDGITDDTAAIQSALTNRGVYFPQGTYLVGTLYPTNNTEIFGYGATLLRKAELLSGQSIFKVQNCTNVLIRNLAFNGNAAAQALDFQNGPFAILVTGSSTNVTLSSLELYSNKSDGIYIGGLGTVPTLIHVWNCNSHDNGRQGMSITSGNQIDIIGGSFSGSYSTDPGCGIDVEPNADTDVLRNIRLVGVMAKDNKGSGMQFGGATSSGQINQGWIEGIGIVIEGNGGSSTGYGLNAYGMRNLHFQGIIKNNGLSGLGLTKDLANFSWDGLIESNMNHGVELVLSPSTRLGVDNVQIMGTIRNNGQRVASTYDGIALNATGTWTNGAGTYASMVTNVTVAARIYDDQPIPTQRYAFNNYDGQGIISYDDHDSTGNTAGDFNSGTPAFWRKGPFLYLINGGLSTSASDPGVGNIQSTNITVLPGGVLSLNRTNFVSGQAGGGINIANYDINPQLQLNGMLSGQLNLGIDGSQNNFWKAPFGKAINLLPDGGTASGVVNIVGTASGGGYTVTLGGAGITDNTATASTLTQYDGTKHQVGLANQANSVLVSNGTQPFFQAGPIGDFVIAAAGTPTTNWTFHFVNGAPSTITHSP